MHCKRLPGSTCPLSLSFGSAGKVIGRSTSSTTVLVALQASANKQVAALEARNAQLQQAAKRRRQVLNDSRAFINKHIPASPGGPEIKKDVPGMKAEEFKVLETEDARQSIADISITAPAQSSQEA